MFGLILTTALQVAVTLPGGYQDMNWGMTVEQLTSQYDVHKAAEGSEYGYADHTEIDPEVYVRITEDNTRIEYYFFEGRLYKIYVVYDRTRSSADFYQKLIGEAQKRYGPAQSHYQENVFGILVLHVKWDDGTSSMDLRSGAGYIYEVLVDISAERKKANQIREKRTLKKSI